MIDMKSYLVVGASSGIGREVAKQMSDETTIIVLVARREEKLKEIQEELSGKSLIIPCDICNQEDVERVFDTLKEQKIKLDGMVYCAGIWFTVPIKNMQREDLENMFRINVFGFYEMCRLFAGRSISNKGASIVGVSSYSAVLRESGMSAYAMSKEAMNVQVQVLAKEFVKRKIRINTVMPAIVMSKMASENNHWTEEELADVQRRQAFGIIPIENVVGVIKFLMSDDAQYITGESIAISAGYQN